MRANISVGAMRAHTHPVQIYIIIRCLAPLSGIMISICYPHSTPQHQGQHTLARIHIAAYPPPVYMCATRVFLSSIRLLWRWLIGLSLQWKEICFWQANVQTNNSMALDFRTPRRSAFLWARALNMDIYRSFCQKYDSRRGLKRRIIR